MSNDNSLVQPFGYSEMYEFENIPVGVSKIGKFVQFNKHFPDKIELASSDENILGVTSVNYVSASDDPDNWQGENLANEYGDLLLRKEKLAVGIKQYDQLKELPYIQTKPWDHFIPIKNPKFDPKVKYVKRSNRKEWVHVTLIGKCVVEDNGKCIPGEFCMPYKGKLQKNKGIAVPAVKTAKAKYYVLKRISKNTILIVLK